MKKILALVLAVTLLAAGVMPVFAAVPEDNTVSPLYNYMQENSVGLVINTTTGIATCDATCYASSGYTVYVEYKLQRYTGSRWINVKTWSSSADSYASVHEIWAVYSGYTYRGYATFRVYNAAGDLLESDVNIKSYTYP